MRSCPHLSLPMLGELGCLQTGKRGADLIFQLVSRRYERRPAIVTTNVGTGMWADVFGNAVTASAIADRLCHHCHLIRITGRSYRTKDLPAGSLSRKGAGTDSGRSHCPCWWIYIAPAGAGILPISVDPGLTLT